MPTIPPSRAARGALAALSLATLLSALGTSIANVGLPVLARHFDARFGAIQWVVLAYLAASTAMVALAGRLGDRYGRRRLLLGGIALFTVASVGCGMAPSLGMLVVARALQGIGAAAMMALAMPFVGAAVPGGHAGSAIGLLGTMSAAGTALGPSVGGIMIALFGWPALFLAGVPLGGLAFAMAWAFLPPDGAGPQVGAAAAPDGRSVLLLAGLAANALVTAVVMTTLVVGPFYLSGALALDSARTGLVMSCGPLAAALAGVPAGRAVDRHGPGRVALSGLACMLAGCTLLGLLPVSAGIAGYAIPLSMCTTGYALFQAANNTAVMGAIAPGRRGAASGLLSLSRNLGLIAGASAMGALFAAASGIDAAGAAAPTAGMRITFGACAVLVLLAAAIARRTGRTAVRLPA
jgi:MFS family permease